MLFIQFVFYARLIFFVWKGGFLWGVGCESFFFLLPLPSHEKFPLFFRDKCFADTSAIPPQLRGRDLAPVTALEPPPLDQISTSPPGTLFFFSPPPLLAVPMLANNAPLKLRHQAFFDQRLSTVFFVSGVSSPLFFPGLVLGG